MKNTQPREQRILQLLQKHLQAAQGGRRDQIDVLRTALWYTEIKARLNAYTGYEIERLLEPKAFWKNEYGERVHRNKWSRYEFGKHVPRNALATKVDLKFPGTKRLLNHVLWEALRIKSSTNENVDDWLRQLSPDIQKIIFHASRHGSENDWHASLSGRQLKMLERRAGIDTLACLTIILQECAKRGERVELFKIGTSLYRVLLILCTTIPIGNFALELLKIYRERVFSLARHKGQIFHLEDAHFLDAVGILRTIFLALEDNPRIGVGWDARVQAVCSLWDGGGHGFAIKFALDPIIGPDGPLTDINATDYRDFERQKRFRQWAKDQMSSGERETLPPRELW